MDRPPRWKQRFDNFERAYKTFFKLADMAGPGEIENIALIQMFEIVFELWWKTMKDYLSEEGFEVASPKAAIRQAFQSGYIHDGELWMTALEKRNATVHTYDSKILEETAAFIRRDFFPLIRGWRESFKDKHQG